MAAGRTTGSIFGISEAVMRLATMVTLIIGLTVFIVRLDANLRVQTEAIASIKAVLQAHDGRLHDLEVTRAKRESYELGVEDGLRDGLGQLKQAAGRR